MLQCVAARVGITLILSPLPLSASDSQPMKNETSKKPNQAQHLSISKLCNANVVSHLLPCGADKWKAHRKPDSRNPRSFRSCCHTTSALPFLVAVTIQTHLYEKTTGARYTVLHTMQTDGTTDSYLQPAGGTWHFSGALDSS